MNGDIGCVWHGTLGPSHPLSILGQDSDGGLRGRILGGGF